MRISDWSSDVCSSDLAAGGKAETITADVVLVSIGRKPNTDGLALEKAGLSTNKRGQIENDHDFATAIPGIWAIGDVVPGPLLAHQAEEEGIAGAENNGETETRRGGKEGGRRVRTRG